VFNPGNATGERILSAGGLYAPTIRHNDGTFFITCTNVVRNAHGDESCSENFILTTRRIWECDWSDPIWFDFEGIDPSLFFDDDGRVYMHGSRGPGPWTTISLVEIDVSNGDKKSPERTIWRGTGGTWLEGPHIYKNGQSYHLLASEGGTHEGHSITAARSVSGIWGPYVAYEDNPMLPPRDRDSYIRYVGHCDAFQGEGGNWWGVCLGVRKGVEGRCPMGRETFLTHGKWEEGGFLSFCYPDMVLEDIAIPESTGDLSVEPLVDFVYIRDANLEDYDISPDGKTIQIVPSTVELSSSIDSPAFVGKRQRRLHGYASGRIQTTSMNHFCAGLSVYKDEIRNICIFFDSATCSIVTQVTNDAQGISRCSRTSIRCIGSIELKIEYEESEYRLLYRAVEDWVCVIHVDALCITDMDFVGPVIGVFATATDRDINIMFSDFHVE